MNSKDTLPFVPTSKEAIHSRRPHKGGRWVEAPSARMTPADKARLVAHLAQTGQNFGDWLAEVVQQLPAQEGGAE